MTILLDTQPKWTHGKIRSSFNLDSSNSFVIGKCALMMSFFYQRGNLDFILSQQVNPRIFSLTWTFKWMQDTVLLSKQLLNQIVCMDHIEKHQLAVVWDFSRNLYIFRPMKMTYGIIAPCQFLSAFEIGIIHKRGEETIVVFADSVNTHITIFELATAQYLPLSLAR